MPLFKCEALVFGTLHLGTIEANDAVDAEATAWAALKHQDLTARLPELQRVMVEHMMVDPARPAESEVRT